jgi:uncharacterized protein YndB with AHSA1/START domain
MMKKSVKRSFTLPHSCDEVWQALTNSASLADWMYPNDFEPRVGHRFTFRVPPKPQVKFEGLVVHCEVLTCNPPKELSFTWVAGEIDTRVEYRLEASGAGTQVHFEQYGFENDQEHARQGAEYGWAHMHGKLITLLVKDSV